MKSSDQTNEINKALSQFKKDVQSIVKDKSVSMKGVSKTGKDFNVNYEYAPLEFLQETAKVCLANNDLTINQFLDSEKLIDNGSEYLQTTIITRIGHSSGQFISSSWPIDLTGLSKEQDRGSKITYNRRYAYQAALDLILIGEDNDAVGVINDLNNKNNKPIQQFIQKTQPKHIEKSAPQETKVLSNYDKILSFSTKLGFDQLSLKMFATEWAGTPVEFENLSQDQCKSLCEYIKTKKEGLK
jgi:ERF superfamily